jgi:hypothetical protein
LALYGLTPQVAAHETQPAHAKPLAKDEWTARHSGLDTAVGHRREHPMQARQSADAALGLYKANVIDWGLCPAP